MANRLEFSVGIDGGGFRRGMMEIEASAKATNARLQAITNNAAQLRRSLFHPSNLIYEGQQYEILQQLKNLELKKTGILINANAERDAIEKKYQAYRNRNAAAWLAVGQTSFAQTMENPAVIAARNAEQKAAAALRMEQLAMLTNVARGYGASASQGGGHGMGGMTGIIRESLVIIREISMGRGLGRIGGSATLLAQYLGVLNLALKSTATEALLASKAATELSIKMAAQALAAKGTAEYETLLAAATKQEAVAAEKAKDAQIALATATITLNPIFFVVAAAILAMAGATYFAWRQFKELTEDAKTLSDALNPLNRNHKQIAEEVMRANENLEKNIDLIKEITSSHISESDAIERKIKLLEMEGRARGYSNRQIALQKKALLDAEIQSLSKKANDEAAKAADAAKAVNDAELKNAITQDDFKRVEEARDKTAKFADENSQGTAKMFLENMMTSLFVSSLNPNVRDGSQVFANDSTTAAKIAAHAQLELDKKQAAANQSSSQLKAQNDALATANKVLKETQDALNKARADVQDIGDELKFPDKESKNRSLPGGDALVRVGNFLGTSRNGIENLAAEHVKIARETLGHIKSIDAKTGHTSYSGT